MIISKTSSFGERKWIAARDYDIISSINFICSKKKKLSYITSISKVFIKIKKKKNLQQNRNVHQFYDNRITIYKSSTKLVQASSQFINFLSTGIIPKF